MHHFRAHQVVCQLTNTCSTPTAVGYLPSTTVYQALTGCRVEDTALAHWGLPGWAGGLGTCNALSSRVPGQTHPRTLAREQPGLPVQEEGMVHERLQRRSNTDLGLLGRQDSNYTYAHSYHPWWGSEQQLAVGMPES